MVKLAYLAAAATPLFTRLVLADQQQPGEKIVINAPGQPNLDDGLSDSGEKEPFNPRRFRKRKVQCFAWDRSTDPWTENLLDITWVDLNPEAKRTLLFVHGWPGLWSTWSNQIEEFRVRLSLFLPLSEAHFGIERLPPPRSRLTRFWMVLAPRGPRRLGNAPRPRWRPNVSTRSSECKARGVHRTRLGRAGLLAGGEAEAGFVRGCCGRCGPLLARAWRFHPNRLPRPALS
ncbi:hypothetical protein FS749_005673 [Ceratobasidium sp. UAMH 11750]|nr:hypothetical protein FS749_005673 [Ceratobasidium sp. UAMH 11750]